MLVTEGGEARGSVSGGCLEADVVRRALHALARGEAALVRYETDEDDDEYGVGTGCRGEITVLVEPLPLHACHLTLLESWLSRREVGVVATVMRSDCATGPRLGARLLVGGGGVAADELGDPELLDDALQILARRRGETRSYARPGGALEVGFEVIEPFPRLVLFGAGHDAEPIAALGGTLGWHVTVVELGPGNRTRERFADADAIILAGPESACAHIPLEADTAAVLMTHNHRKDRRLLEILLPSRVGYLGLLGPRDRAVRLLSGLDVTGLDRLHAPVGLDVGADTPEEIALSIVAEIRAFFAGRKGGRLRDRRGPIHPREPGHDEAHALDSHVRVLGHHGREARPGDGNARE
jgi:xanthine/CO dehydrogenase XdhC/CoxF family maturation factor